MHAFYFHAVCLLLSCGAVSLQIPTKRVGHFINLTNGLEAIDALAFEKIQFCRIQSSHCEANDYQAILWNLDHNLLMHLALGTRCYVYDFGSRSMKWPQQEEEIKIPRAIWLGLEWARYALSTIWRCEHIETPIIRGYSSGRLFDQQLATLPKPLSKKLKYYRKFQPTRVDLRGVYYKYGTTRDGDYDFYRNLASSYFNSSPETPFSSSASSPPSDISDDDYDDDRFLPPDFLVYRAADWLGLGRAAGSARTRR